LEIFGEKNFNPTFFSSFTHLRFFGDDAAASAALAVLAAVPLEAATTPAPSSARMNTNSLRQSADL
jgi:hypothetical protein